MKICGLDVETSKIPAHFPWAKGYFLSCVSISYPNNTERTWVFKHSENANITPKIYQKQLDEIEAELAKFDIVAAHNAKFDRNQLRDLKFPAIFCTMVAEYLLKHQKRGRLKLDDLSNRYSLPQKIDKIKIMWDAGIDTDKIPLSILKRYCESDARKARLICGYQHPLIRQAGLSKIFQLQMRWLDLLSLMESNGIKWDKSKATILIDRYKNYRRILTKRIYQEIAPFHPSLDISLTSGDELSAIIYGGYIKRKEKCPVIKTKNVKTQIPFIFTYKNGTQKIKKRWKDHPDTKVIKWVFQDKWYEVKGLGIKPLPKSELDKSTDKRPYYKTDKNTLPMLNISNHIQKRVIKMVVKLSSINKVITTFINEDRNTGLINKIGTDGMLHTNYNQTVTATGRLSSSDPNSQNLPRGNTSPIKQCIIPRFDYIVNADLSQIEWRVPAFLSQDPVMMLEIANGVDQHGSACVNLMGLILNKLNRFYAKTFNFRMIYGGSAWGFFKDSNMPKFPIKRWEQIVKEFYKKYMQLKVWQDKNILHVIQGNGTLTMPTGRTFKFYLQPNGKYNERQIKNYPVQGTAGDILFLAAVIIWGAIKKAGLKSLPILTVHDSLVFDCPKKEVDKVADICMSVFNDLPRYIQQYWGIKWNVKLTGEVEKGLTYGKMKRIR